MQVPVQPILLLSDSQLLFWRSRGRLFLETIRDRLGDPPWKAAYVGASNGDRPEFYELFRGAMDGIGIADCCHVPADPSARDLEFFDAAHLILLSGGDPLAGWMAFGRSGLRQKVIERYYAGALLVGVSAGAVQLGLSGVAPDGEAFETFKLAPFLVDVHDEPEWGRLRAAVRSLGPSARGLGIPLGGGALLHPDLSIEPIRHALTEMTLREDGVESALLLPPDPAGRQGQFSEPREGESESVY